MLIKCALDIPAVLKRELDAYRANDPISVAETYTPNARLLTRLDPLAAELLGLSDTEPVLATGSVGIMKFYAYDMMLYKIQDMEMVSAIRSGRNVLGICNWALTCRETGKEVLGSCNSVWTLDPAGRKFVSAQSSWSIFTPEWNRKIN